MRTIISPFLFLFVATPLFAQEDVPPEIGFIRFVNAIAPGVGNTMLSVDGENLYAKGYRFGQRTGGVGLGGGTRSIAVTKDGIETGETTVAVQPGKTTTLIAFAEMVEAGNEEEPPTWQARILRLKQQDAERGYRLTVVSVCNQREVSFRVVTREKRAGDPKTVERFNTTTVDLGDQRAEVEIWLADDAKNALCGMSLDEPGNYVVVLYNNAEGDIEAMDFYDPKFVVAG